MDTNSGINAISEGVSLAPSVLNSKSGVTIRTEYTVKSDHTNDATSYSTYLSRKDAVGEEDLDEESTIVCERETTPVITDPTPKQILGMFKWNGDTLYEHLKRLLEQLISTRPENIMDYFDQYSREIRFKKPPEDPIMYLQNAVKLGKMYGLIYPTMDDEGTLKPKIADPWENVYYFEEMCICLPREELYQITLGLRKLALVEGLSKIRFWGKIFGIERSYIVAECDLTYDEIQKRIATDREEGLSEEEDIEEEEEESSIDSHLDEPFGISDIFKKTRDDDFEGDSEEEDEIIKPVYKKLNAYKKPPVPRPAKPEVKKMEPEKNGEGVNKKVYYVCHEPGDEWILLPNAKPEHIIIARKIRKYFKGYLLAKVESYPPFKGTERELLRAQIARITAGTHISPLGFYQFGGGEEGFGPEESEGETEIVANLDYEPLSPQDLLKTAFWVHHSPHILRIGRTTYWEEPSKMEEEMEEELQIEAKDDEKKAPKEVGPPLLTPISEDVSLEMVQPWTIKCSSVLLPASGVVVARSNLWPGSYAFSKGRIFENIYIGWGLKLCEDGFNPTYLPFQQQEYELGPEIMEIADPTPEMEDQWKESHKPRPPPKIHPEEETGDYGHLEEEED